MGQKTKGGMWCDQCQRPTMGVKNTHRVRNAVSLVALPATNALSLGGLKSEGYVCPTCGGRARQLPGSRSSSWTVLVLMAASLMWIFVAVALALVTGCALPYHVARRGRAPLGVERWARAAYGRVSAWVGVASRRFAAAKVQN